MQNGRAGGAPPRNVGVGVVGYGFMGRAHSFAYQRLWSVAPERGIAPRLVAIAGRTRDKVEAAASRYGYDSHTTDWRTILDDDRVEAVDNCTQPYLHAEPSIAALQAGKHVLCEKPLAPTLAEARAMRDAAADHPELVAMCGFNYRFLPAVALARRLLADGELGRVYHFRAQYLQEGRHDPRRPAFVGPEALARGALGSLGSHAFDLARIMVGEITSVCAATQIYIPLRPHPSKPDASATVIDDDSFQCLVDFAGGASGLIEATFVAAGRKNFLSFEVNGEKGSIRFNLERLNELEVYLPGMGRADIPGFASVLVTEPGHPFIDQWWPRGHTLGWEHTFVHETQHFLRCIVDGRRVGPEGASFEDGYQSALVAEAVLRSTKEGRKVRLDEIETRS